MFTETPCTTADLRKRTSKERETGDDKSGPVMVKVSSNKNNF